MNGTEMYYIIICYYIILYVILTAVSGVKYPIIPILRPFTVRTLDFIKFGSLANTGSSVRSRLLATTGMVMFRMNNSTSFTPSSNS